MLAKYILIYNTTQNMLTSNIITYHMSAHHIPNDSIYYDDSFVKIQES